MDVSCDGKIISQSVIFEYKPAAASCGQSGAHACAQTTGVIGRAPTSRREMTNCVTATQPDGKDTSREKQRESIKIVEKREEEESIQSYFIARRDLSTQESCGMGFAKSLKIVEKNLKCMLWQKVKAMIEEDCKMNKMSTSEQTQSKLQVRPCSRCCFKAYLHVFPLYYAEHYPAIQSPVDL